MIVFTKNMEADRSPVTAETSSLLWVLTQPHCEAIWKQCTPSSQSQSSIYHGYWLYCSGCLWGCCNVVFSCSPEWWRFLSVRSGPWWHFERISSSLLWKGLWVCWLSVSDSVRRPQRVQTQGWILGVSAAFIFILKFLFWVCFLAWSWGFFDSS